MNPTTLLTMTVLAGEAASAPKGDHWVVSALLTAALAAAGYGARALHENLKARWNARKSRHERLHKLTLLLAESNTLFHDQNYKARELLKTLQQRIPEKVPAQGDFDDVFYQLYPDFTNDEHHVHSLIRSITMTSLRRVNADMANWLRSNTDLRQRDARNLDYAELSKQLAMLEKHLNLWHSKYHAFFLQDETDHKHCLVYLASERRDGVEFPKNLEPALAKVLGTKP